MCISVKKHPTARHGFLVDPEFFVYQHRNRRSLLELVQEYFGTGRIHPKPGNPDVLVYAITSRRSISEKVIPFLDHYMVYSARRADILRYEQALQLFEQGMHRTRDGLVRIVELAYSMNHDGKQRQRPLHDVIDRILRGHTPDTPAQGVMIWSDLHGDVENQAEEKRPGPPVETPGGNNNA